MKKFYWKGICNENRNVGISEMEKTINEEGYIVQFKFFSDVLIGVVIEIEERRIDALFQKLKQRIRLTSDTEDQPSDSGNEAQILLNVTFSRGTGDFRVEVPAV